MSLQHPWLGLVPLVLFLVLAWRQARQPRPALSFPGLEDLRSAPVSARVVMFRARPWVHLLVAVLLCLAMARPRAGRTVEVVRAHGVDIMLALDVSGSMSRGTDLPPHRLAVAKEVLARFVDGRKNDRIGLVIFAGAAFTRCPLTMDYSILQALIENIHEGAVREDGTAIGMALGACVNRLRDSQAESKVVVLLTDGANNAGSIGPEAAAELAKDRGIRVYTVGVGAQPGAAQGRDPFSLMGLRQMRVADLDERLLTKIAESTGGRYFRATDKKALAAIFETIDRLEASEVEAQTFTRYRELFDWLLAPALALLLLDLALGATLLRSLP